MDIEEKILNKLNKNFLLERVKIRPVKQYTRDKLFFIKKYEKQDYIQHRLTKMQPFFLELLEISEFKSVNHTSQTHFYTFGMIVSPNGSKITEDNVYLASNIDGSNEVPVKLNLKYLKKYSLFPGEIVAILGKNTNGNEIYVEEIHCMPILDINPIYDAEKKRNEKIYQTPLEIICCSGPYLVNDTNSLSIILLKNPDLFILHGPFITTPSSSMAPMEYFKSEIIDKLEAWLRQSLYSKIILIPTIDDILTLGIYPQFPINLKGINDRIIIMSNPCQFYVNEFLFGSSTLDILLSLTSEECFYNGEHGINDQCSDLLFSDDRPARMAYHVVFQKSFLPVFPCKDSVNLGASDILDMDVTPDFLILSSKIRHFSKNIGPSVVINTGIQSKPENKRYGKIVIGDDSKQRYKVTLESWI
ncbi:DNA polymerase alpha subunit B [Astathelohania contejeani]|uniref:DNA polymerase alpha subunit B n=1 Tax=Astathelohania contejeani TaxID=164912 RepID=A0ABQ7HVQ5_9MICR|nr:DNA polymerase alpha subunit B [Thelohania contejeani]